MTEKTKLKPCDEDCTSHLSHLLDGAQIKLADVLLFHFFLSLAVVWQEMGIGSN